MFGFVFSADLCVCVAYFERPQDRHPIVEPPCPKCTTVLFMLAHDSHERILLGVCSIDRVQCTAPNHKSGRHMKISTITKADRSLCKQLVIDGPICIACRQQIRLSVLWSPGSAAEAPPIIPSLAAAAATAASAPVLTQIVSRQCRCFGLAQSR